MATVNKADTTFSAKDIHTAASVYEYTANGTYKVRFQVQFTSLAGGGDYSVWLTLNDGDAVADNIIYPKTTVTLAAGAQSIWFASGELDVMNGDVINVFALGLAGDTSIAGIVRVFSDDMTGVTGATLSSGTGTGQVSLDSGKVLLQATQTGVTIPTVTTLTNAPTGMALEATLTAMKGSGWTTETLKALADAITNIPAGITTADILAATVEGAYSLEDVLRIMVGVLAGKVTGGDTTTITFRDLSDTLDIIAATVDTDGNRSAVTVTLE